MKIRGRRECQSCGNRWSYYRTGSVACPSCGDLRSVGLDERTLHTASSTSFDLAQVRSRVDEEPIERLAELAAERCRDYVIDHGFIDAGELVPIEESFLAASELRTVAGELRRRMRPTEAETEYVLSLLAADRGERPPPEAVPESLRAARGLAYADTVDAYRSDLRTYLREYPDPSVDGAVERLGDAVRRVRALDGDVPATDSEALVSAAESLGSYLRTGESEALERADRTLDELR